MFNKTKETVPLAGSMDFKKKQTNNKKSNANAKRNSIENIINGTNKQTNKKSDQNII